MLFAKVDRCDGGYIEYGQSRCNKCDVVILPRWTRWLDWRHWESWIRHDLRWWVRNTYEDFMYKFRPEKDVE